MLPPESEPALMSTRTGAQLFDLRDPCSGGAAEASEFPELPKVMGAGGPLLEFEQGVDEVLFVPSGWWHQVSNLEDTLSVNHNWINAANISWSWSYLQQQHARIVSEVPDCAEDEETAQQLLEFKYEQNYGTFMELLLGVREREAARLNAASDAEERFGAAPAYLDGSERSGTNPPAAQAAQVEAAVDAGTGVDHACETTAEAMPSSITANEVLLVLPRKHNDGETEQPSVIGVRFAALSTDQSSSTKSSTTAIGGPNTLRVAGVVPGTPAAELGPALRVGAELLEIQGQSVAGWYGQCTLQLLRQVASQRPLRLKFSSGMLASPLSVTELVGTPAAASAPTVRTLREAEGTELHRRVLMGRLSLLRVDRLLREVIATPACQASLGADMAELLSAELEEECLQLGTEESLLAAMGVRPPSGM